MKINAVAFSEAGDRYLGRPYTEMDCQAFVEKCMADCGCRKNLAGSNAWYRECLRGGWAGTPEECVKTFGLIPKGALLFILSQDGKEPAKYREDGVGNAGHIGIKTGRGKGAIHSSASRGCVAESEFHDKTVRNGGWNRVGLLRDFDYGNRVNERMENEQLTMNNEQLTDISGNGADTLTVTAPRGDTVNLRVKPSRNAALVDRIPVGSEAELLESRGDWARIRVRGRTGWMMKEFLTADSRLDLPGADSGDSCYSVVISGLDWTQAQALAANYPGNSEIEKTGEPLTTAGG